MYRMPWDLIDLKDELVTIINRGKYAFQVTNGIPTWQAGEGEQLMYFSGTDRRFYVFMSGGWNWVQWGGPGTGFSGGGSYIVDSDGDTFVHTESNADCDIISFCAGGSAIFNINTSMMVIQQDFPLAFNGTAESTKIVYNSTSYYLEFWLNGGKRLEI